MLQPFASHNSATCTSRVRTVQEEVFQYEPAFSALQGGTAFQASKFAINYSILGFDAHKVIRRAAIRALEPRDLLCRHGELPINRMPHMVGH